MIVNERKEKEREVEKDKYPWLDDNNERKYMTDKEILDKHRFRQFMSNRIRKLQGRDMIYEYREAFSLRDEIETCPNIEIDIDVTDKTPFFIRPYHIMEGQENLRQRNEKVIENIIIIL